MSERRKTLQGSDIKEEGDENFEWLAHVVALGRCLKQRCRTKDEQDT